MKTKNSPRPNLFISRTKLLRVGIFIAFVAIVTFPLFTVSSASFSQKTSRDNELDRAASTVWSAAASISQRSHEAVKSQRSHETVKSLNPAAFGLIPEAQVPFLAFLTQQGESLASYESTCTTLKQNFIVGDTVCAKVTNISVLSQKIYWINPDGYVVQSDNVSSTSPSATRQVNQAGNWKLYLVDSDGALRQAYRFSVSNPAQPQVDLSVIKYIVNGASTVAAGANINYRIIVQNNGPDTATVVQLTESVPNDTTYVSSQQDSGPTFTCTNNNVCTIASLAAGDSAVFSFVYQVNSGTPTGTVISNTADVTSATAESHSADNTWTASTTVSGNAGGGGTCTLSCPSNITTPADTTQNGQSGAIVHFDSPSAQGSSCGAISVDHCNDCFFPVGTTVVNATENGTTGASCSFTVTVTEGAPPTITCPPDKTATADSNCKATVDPGSPTTTGSGVTVTSSRSDGLPLSDPYPAGVTTITWTASNSSGTVSCTQTITVNDITAPTITCPANITTGNDAGQCSATVNPGTATATDNCDSPTVTGTRSDGQALNAPYPKGTTTITWTATDSSGNSASCAQTVTVNDTENPTVTCPANITRGTDPGTCSATIDPGTATASDNCPGATVSGTRSDGQALNAPYPKGTTTITWTATDASGNHSSSCTQTVTVNDTENPTVTCPANITRGTDPGTCSATIDPGTATASDNCPGATVSGTRSDGQALNAPYPKGTTTITWTATDASGNHSSCTQTVTVNDTEAPAITCPTNISVNSGTGACSAIVNVGIPTATDNCDTVIPVPSRSDNKPITDPFPVGTTTITWTATDSSGNHSSCNQTVVVADNEKPQITCPADVTTSTEPGACSAHVNHGTATATDNCSIATVSGARSDGAGLDDSYPKGTTTITWTATDLSGNQSSCSQRITVNDNEPPTITCPANIVVYLPPNTTSTSMAVNYQTPVGSDNCPGATTTQTAGLPSGASFPVGTTTNSFRVTDAAGNFAQCSFTVTVLYNFTGFFSPVNNPPILNVVNAGRSIPVKFSLSGNKGLNIFATDSPQSGVIPCDASAPAADLTDTTTGNSSLSYSAGSDQYNYNWKTDSAWAGTCRQLVVTLNDGSPHVANFKFK